MAKKRPEAPRPYIYNPNLRVRVVTFRATQAQYEALKAYADSQDLTITMALEEAYNLLMEKASK